MSSAKKPVIVREGDYLSFRYGIRAHKILGFYTVDKMTCVKLSGVTGLTMLSDLVVNRLLIQPFLDILAYCNSHPNEDVILFGDKNPWDHTAKGLVK